MSRVDGTAARCGTRPSRRALLVALALGAMTACSAEPEAGPTPTSAPRSRTARPVPSAEADFGALEARYGARLGVHAFDTGTGATVAHRADERFAFCSTFKALAVAAVLDRGPGVLDERLEIAPPDLVGESPITRQFVHASMTVREVCDAAMRYSDGTAGNLLLGMLGGPAALTSFARSIGDTSFRMDRVEPEITEAKPGDARDTASPRGLGTDLRTLLLEGGLRPDASALLQDWMVRNTTGDARIRAGVPANWIVGDKTGTGSYGTANDIAVLWPDAGAPIVLALMSSKADPEAEPSSALLAEAAAAVVRVLRSN